MAVGFPTKVSYANGDVFSASDINDTNGTINLLTSTTLSSQAGKNSFINGGMDIWQRGTTSGNITTAITYGADRWCAVSGASTIITQSRQTTSDTTNLPTIQYCNRVQRTAGQTGTSTVYFSQSIESANSIRFAGKAVTYSFYARRGANYSGGSNNIIVALNSGTGTDQNMLSGGFTGSASLVNQFAALTTTWQRFTYTATVASTATELGCYFAYDPVGTAGAADYFEVTGLQIELGSTATTFSRAGGTIQGELAACQRYYETGFWAYEVPAAGNFVSTLSFNTVKRTTSATVSYTNVAAPASGTQSILQTSSSQFAIKNGAATGGWYWNANWTAANEL
jgi:hypothetical protein